MTSKNIKDSQTIFVRQKVTCIVLIINFTILYFISNKEKVTRITIRSHVRNSKTFPTGEEKSISIRNL